MRAARPSGQRPKPIAGAVRMPRWAQKSPIKIDAAKTRSARATGFIGRPVHPVKRDPFDRRVRPASFVRRTFIGHCNIEKIYASESLILSSRGLLKRGVF